jgi:hypothetical protein
MFLLDLVNKTCASHNHKKNAANHARELTIEIRVQFWLWLIVAKRTLSEKKMWREFISF